MIISDADRLRLEAAIGKTFETQHRAAIVDDADWSRLEAALGEAIEPAHRAAITDVADYYLKLRDTFDTRTTPKATKKWLAGVAKNAAALAKLARQDERTFGWFLLLSSPVTEERDIEEDLSKFLSTLGSISELAGRTKREPDQLGPHPPKNPDRPGRHPDMPLDLFVGEMGRIYKAITGKTPGLTRKPDADGAPSGPFYRLLSVALELIGEPRKPETIAKAIRKQSWLELE